MSASGNVWGDSTAHGGVRACIHDERHGPPSPSSQRQAPGAVYRGTCLARQALGPHTFLHLRRYGMTAARAADVVAPRLLWVVAEFGPFIP